MPIISQETAIKLILSGNPVALPTETVYGLAADITNAEAVKKIFAIKNRPFFDPLIVHVSSIEECKSLVVNWPEAADALAKRFWPGPLTMVIKKNPDKVSDLITSGLDMVAIRLPKHPVFLDIIKKTGKPLAAPSANRFGKTSPSEASHVIDEFKDSVNVVDGGKCEVGIESTIVEISNNNELTLLRPGMITAEELSKATGFKTYVKPESSKQAGHLAFHYQPELTFVILAEGTQFTDLKNQTSLWPNQLPAFELKLSDNPNMAARELYSQLRVANSKNNSLIYWKMKELHKDANWLGILDRLKKAAHASLERHGDLLHCVFKATDS